MGEAGSWSVEWEPGAPRERIEAILEALARDATPAGAELVKRSPARRVYRVLADPTDPALYVKCYPARGWAAWRAPAAREFANLGRLAAAGLPAVAPLACAGLAGHLDVLVTREQAGARPLKDRLVENARGPGPGEAALLEELAGLLHRLHEAGFWHRDPHTGNLLVDRAGALVLVDVQKLRALPVAVPRVLRLRDLGLLYDDLGPLVGDVRESLARSYAALAGEEHERFLADVRAAAQRRGRRRLRSRGRRCVRNSSGFRVEREGSLRVYRRADAPVEAIRSAIDSHRRQLAGAEDGAGSARSVGVTTRVENVRAGPPPGPATRPFDRGQGRPEAGSPASGSVAVTEFREAGVSSWIRGRLGLHPGMRAWRGAHARLLEGEDVPAPLALVEEWRAGRVVASWYLARWQDQACR